MVILILPLCISACKFGFHSTSVERVDYATLWTPSPHLDMSLIFFFFGLGVVAIMVELCDYLQAKFCMNGWRVKSSIHSLNTGNLCILYH